MTVEPHRPRYHFSPDNWMNDPIPFYWDGEFHIFFQHNPDGACWGAMHWGHAVSRNLAHWEQLQIALAPTPGGPDSDGVWTGCVVAHDSMFYAFYTGIPSLEPLRQVQCVAMSRDLIHWKKHPGNPIIAEKPPGFGACFRDPQVWREPDAWYMVIGGEQTDHQGGAAFRYRSEDMLRWDYLHPLCLGDVTETAFQFECPDFFPLGETHVLLSSQDTTHWQRGRYTSHRFIPETLGVCDSAVFYAAKTLQDEQGRRLLFGWLREERPEAAQIATGWSGVLSLPRVLSILPDGTLGQEPAPELRTLRGRHTRCEDLHVAGALLLPGVHGDSLELVARFAPSEATAFGLLVRCSPDLQERTAIAFDRTSWRLGDTPLALAPDEEMTLHVFIDRSVVETFANRRACLTQRVYPDRPDCLGVGLFARGGSVRVRSVDIWELAA